MRFNVRKKRDRKKCLFDVTLGGGGAKSMLGIVSKVFSQVENSQLCNFPSSNFPKVRLGLPRAPHAAMGERGRGSER